MQHGGTRIGVGAIGAAAAAVVVVALSACGSDEDTGPSTSEVDLTVVAKDTLEFDRDSYTVAAGEVTVAYENGGSQTHTLLIEGVDDFKLTVVTSGDTDVGTVELEPGEYRIYCDVPGHESMQGTLVVE